MQLCKIDCYLTQILVCVDYNDLLYLLGNTADDTMEHQTAGMVCFSWSDTLHRNRRPPISCIYMMCLLQCSTYRYHTLAEPINLRINYTRYTERTGVCLLTTLRVSEGVYWLHWEDWGCLLTTLRGPMGAYWLHWEYPRVLTDYAERNEGAYWLH